MQKIRSTVLASMVALLFLLVGTGSAQAIVFGNFAPEIKSGESMVGAGLSDDQIAGMYDLGLGQGVLGLMAGTLEPESSVSGTEFGVMYKHLLGEVFKIDRFPVRMGVLGGLRRASLETTIPAFGPIPAQTFETTLTRLHLGLGGSMSPVKQLNVFAGALYERATAEVEGFSETESGLGFMAGAEFWISPAFVAGAEIHSGLVENDLGLYAMFKF